MINISNSPCRISLPRRKQVSDSTRSDSHLFDHRACAVGFIFFLRVVCVEKWKLCVGLEVEIHFLVHIGYLHLCCAWFEDSRAVKFKKRKMVMSQH